MSDNQIDPQLVISDLLDQIKKLTLENSMLRVYVGQAMGAIPEKETSSQETTD